MIQNKYHGKCSACGNTVNPFEGFIRRAPRGDGWIFKHQSCVATLNDVMGEATQPVRMPETRVCSKCDKHKPLDKFNGFLSCIDCRSEKGLLRP